MTQICRLNKALYRLKISPRRWNKRFPKVVLRLDLHDNFHEPCLYRDNGKMVMRILYVDDMLIAMNENLEEIKDCLNKTFQMKDLGESKQLLGMRIKKRP